MKEYVLSHRTKSSDFSSSDRRSMVLGSIAGGGGNWSHQGVWEEAWCPRWQTLALDGHNRWSGAIEGVAMWVKDFVSSTLKAARNRLRRRFLLVPLSQRSVIEIPGKSYLISSFLEILSADVAGFPAKEGNSRWKENLKKKIYQRENSRKNC